MDFIDIVTFKINNRQYYLHYNYVKDLPIFEELEKSDKVETIEYMDNIDEEEINIVFRIIYGSPINYKKISIISTLRIYYFMMFLAMEKDIIDNFVKESFKKFAFGDIVEYGIETKQDMQFFDIFPYYTDFFNSNTVMYLRKLENDDLKIALVDRFISRVLEKEYANKLTIYCGCINSYIQSIYNLFSACDDEYIEIKTVWEKNNFIHIKVNDKAIPNVNVTSKLFQSKYYFEDFYGYDVYETVKSHIRQVLLGQVEL